MTTDLRSSDDTLSEGWKWAVSQALAYVRHGDPVGDWYEAALPDRNAFCMRDVAHQSTGAQVLDLRRETKNMLLRFAENIAASRDWCTYWEITGDNQPAPVDYINDQAFWYNLPANFDVLDCCWRQYLWTGDQDYIQHPTFLNFYERTVSDYIRTWDKDGDGLVESHPSYGHRGLGSYEEATSGISIGGDLIAAQVAAFEAYANILDLHHNNDQAYRLREKANVLRACYHAEWWSDSAHTYHSVQQYDGSLSSEINFGINTFALYFGLINGQHRIAHVIDDLETRFEQANVESKSYFPEVAYRSGRHQAAYDALRHLINPALDRREYPEVSYSVIGAITTGLMGISADATRNQITTLGRLTPQTEWIEVEDLPILSNRIAVRHTHSGTTTIKNLSGAEFMWKADFVGSVKALVVDGRAQVATVDNLPNGQAMASVTCTVAPGAQIRVSAGVV